MDQEKYIKFRAEAEEKGLILPVMTQEPRFYFDMNSGPVHTRQDVNAVWDLVNLVRDYESNGSCGEHRAYLKMVAKEADINASGSELSPSVVVWSRPYHVKTGQGGLEGWKTLEGHFEENGFDVKELYRDE